MARVARGETCGLVSRTRRRPEWERTGTGTLLQPSSAALVSIAEFLWGKPPSGAFLQPCTAAGHRDVPGTPVGAGGGRSPQGAGWVPPGGRSAGGLPVPSTGCPAGQVPAVSPRCPAEHSRAPCPLLLPASPRRPCGEGTGPLQPSEPWPGGGCHPWVRGPGAAPRSPWGSSRAFLQQGTSPSPYISSPMGLLSPPHPSPIPNAWFCCRGSCPGTGAFPSQLRSSFFFFFFLLLNFCLQMTGWKRLPARSRAAGGAEDSSAGHSAKVFWKLRKTRGGPVSPSGEGLAHGWGGVGATQPRAAHAGQDLLGCRWGGYGQAQKGKYCSKQRGLH